MYYLKYIEGWYTINPTLQCQEFTLKTRSEVEVAVNVFYDKAVTDVAHAKPIASLCTVRVK